MNASAKYPINELTEAVKKSCSYAEVMRKLGKKWSGGQQQNLKKWIEKYELDTSHFTGQASRKGKFTSDKNRLISIRGHKCEGCNLKTWLENPIPLELHHLCKPHKGDDDLKLLCCNCHAFTPDYRGKGIKKVKNISDDKFLKAVGRSENIRQLLIELGLAPKGGNYKSVRNRLDALGFANKFKLNKNIKICPSCGTEFVGNKFCSRRCSNSYNMNGAKTRKTTRPSLDVLEKMVNAIGFSATGRIFEVSDNAVRKWLK